MRGGTVVANQKKKTPGPFDNVIWLQYVVFCLQYKTLVCLEMMISYCTVRMGLMMQPKQPRALYQTTFCQ